MEAIYDSMSGCLHILTRVIKEHVYTVSLQLWLFPLSFSSRSTWQWSHTLSPRLCFFFLACFFLNKKAHMTLSNKAISSFNHCCLYWRTKTQLLFYNFHLNGISIRLFFFCLMMKKQHTSFLLYINL